MRILLFLALFVTFLGHTYPVVQQSYPREVSRLYVTQYTWTGYPEQVANVGLLAHNATDAGAAVVGLELGDIIMVTGQDGSLVFAVTEINRYQAIDGFYRFRELETGAEYSHRELFRISYYYPGRLTIQTCIARDGNSEWGLLLIHAEPVRPEQWTRAQE